jgi:hypothetical protein
MLSLQPRAGIRRVWHGWAAEADADAYESLLLETVVPGILARELPGLRSIEVLRHPEVVDGLVEFVTLMDFADHEAVVAFAGGDGSESVVPDAARTLLARFDEHSRHYDLRARAQR